jgi:hypothetical protein
MDAGVEPIPNHQTSPPIMTLDDKILVDQEFSSLCERNGSIFKNSKKGTHLNEQVIQSLNARLWCSYRALGNELADLAELDGHKLGTKSKDSSRAVVSCARSGVYTPTGKQRATSTKKCGCLYKIDLKRGE